MPADRQSGDEKRKNSSRRKNPDSDINPIGEAVQSLSGRSECNRPRHQVGQSYPFQQILGKKKQDVGWIGYLPGQDIF